MAEEQALVLVLDVNPKYFSKCNISETLEILAACIRGYGLMKPKTGVAVIAAYPDCTQYVLRVPAASQATSAEVEVAIVEMKNVVVNRVGELGREGGLVGSSMISQAISRGVCFIKKGKIVVFETSERFSDFSKQHVQLSNCGWALEGRIVVDLVSLGGETSAALSSLSIKSGGVQVAVGHMQAVLFHVVHQAQGLVKTPDTKSAMHMGAVCICHGNPLNCGYVCSVCLAIFCSESSAICAVCGSRFRRESREATTPLNQRSFSDLVG